MEALKRILMISNTASMQFLFLLPWTQLLREMGYEVHIGCNFKEGNNCTEERLEQFRTQLRTLGIPYHQIDFHRNACELHKFKKPLSPMREVLSMGDVEAIHCQTPVCGVCGRIIGRQMHLKVIYTAHGFHFYKGAPLMNWMIFYPIERILAHDTDTLITINHEDYRRAQHFKAGRVEYISGAGVDLTRYKTAVHTRGEVRQALGIPQEATVFISIGELNRNKNHAVLLEALARLHDPSLHLVLVGQDHLSGALQRRAQALGVQFQVHFTGFRDDVPDLLHASDVFCFPSKREGLGFTAIEAMAAGLPLITSDRHGILDYSKDGVTGYTCSPGDVKGFARAMQALAGDDLKRRAMGTHNRTVAEQFALPQVLDQMREIYANTLDVPAPQTV